MDRENLLKVSAKTVLMLLLAVPAVADVAPPVGYSSVPNGIELRPSGDLSGFRFFVTGLSGSLEELDLSSGKIARMDGNGRTGAGRFAVVWAVPAGAVPKGRLESDKSEDFAQKLERNQIEGQVKLVSHDFRKEVVVFNAKGEHYDIYDVSIGDPGGKPVAHPAGSETEGGWPWTEIVVGGSAVLVPLFMLVTLLGVMIYRKKAKA